MGANIKVRLGRTKQKVLTLTPTACKYQNEWSDHGSCLTESRALTKTHSEPNTQKERKGDDTSAFHENEPPWSSVNAVLQITQGTKNISINLTAHLPEHQTFSITKKLRKWQTTYSVYFFAYFVSGCTHSLMPVCIF